MSFRAAPSPASLRHFPGIFNNNGERAKGSSLARFNPHLCFYKSELIPFWWGFWHALLDFLGISECSGPLCCPLYMFRVAPAACQGFFLWFLLFFPSPFVFPGAQPKPWICWRWGMMCPSQRAAGRQSQEGIQPLSPISVASFIEANIPPFP